MMSGDGIIYMTMNADILKFLTILNLSDSALILNPCAALVCIYFTLHNIFEQL